jgi:hypothetical protein
MVNHAPISRLVVGSNSTEPAFPLLSPCRELSLGRLSIGRRKRFTLSLEGI